MPSLDGPVGHPVYRYMLDNHGRPPYPVLVDRHGSGLIARAMPSMHIHPNAVAANDAQEGT